jgi:uncharacterized protein (DUF58 family)
MLDPDHLGAIEKFSLLARGLRGRGEPGKRFESLRGTSLEFSDYRRYEPGEDLRHIDWNVYARLEKLFIRQYRSETNQDVYLILDVSRSMDFGVSNKLDFACRLSLALAYAGLSGMDRVGLATMSDRLQQFIPPKRGKAQLGLILRVLEEVGGSGVSNLIRSCQDLISFPSRGGTAVIVSDFFDPNGYEQGLRLLQAAGLDLFLVQVLDDEEIDPTVRPGEMLEDLESTDVAPITACESVLTHYRVALDRFNAELESFCRRYRAGFLRLLTSCRFEDVVIRSLEAGLIA